MDKLIIKGGRKLCGEVAISGSKNAALPILFATILAPGVHEIRNVPALRDINTTIRLLETLGARVEGRSGTVHVDAAGIGAYRRGGHDPAIRAGPGRLGIAGARDAPGAARANGAGTGTDPAARDGPA